MDEQNNPVPTPAHVSGPSPMPSPFNAPTLRHTENLSHPTEEPAPALASAPATTTITSQATPSVAAPAYGTASGPVVVPAPVPVTEESTPESLPTVSEPIMTPMSTTQEPTNKQLPLVWVICAVVSLILLAFAAVFFISKEAVDTQADAYTNAVVAYVDKVHTDVDAANTASDAKAVLDADAANQPVLKNGFLSSFSEKYTKAKSLNVTVDSKMAEFTARINELAGVDAYINHNKANNAKMTEMTITMQSATVEADVVKAMDDVLVILEDTQATMDAAVFPSDLALAKVQLASVYSDEVKYWTAMIDARKAGDTAAYAAALASYTAAVSGESEPLDTVSAFYVTLAVERNALLEKLDSFHKDLL